MALMPDRVKWRKQQRGVVRGNATRGNFVAFGDFGLQALDPGFVTGRQIEACRVSINRSVAQAGGKYWIRVFPHKPMSAKPLETRMGTGKGEPDKWVAIVRPGTVMFEIAGVTPAIARQALGKAASKLPVRCRLAEKQPEIGG